MDGIGAISPSTRNVDISDLIHRVSNIDVTGINGPHYWSDGNFDGDDDIDITDFEILTANFAASCYTRWVGVPEPQAFSLVCLALLSLAFAWSIRDVGKTRLQFWMK